MKSISHLRAHLALAMALTMMMALGLTLARDASSQEKQPDYKNPRLSVEQRVADLLKRMTLEEKVAQTQALWQQKKLIMDDKGNFSPEKAKDVLKYGLGQITRPSEKKGPREMAEFTNAIQHWVMENTRLGIPVMFHEECLHGHAAPKGTSYPQPIALASSWDTDLVERIFSATAAEVRARGAQQALTPVLDLAREPRWGRSEETYGEDPYLVTRLGVACINGFQGRGPAIDRAHIFATAKHFAAHGQPEGGTNIGPANYSQRVLRDAFLVPFEAAITEAHAMSVMASYNEIDGVPSHANHWLLDDVLRQEWGFQGFIVSDYFAVAELQARHHVAATKEDAARQALEAGVDLELPDIDVYGMLLKEIKAGHISEATLDKTVARSLRAKFLAGLFDDPYADPAYAEQITNNAEHQKLALEAAHKSIILLRNQNNLLPLDRSRVKTIAVIGPNAEKLHLGGYSDDPGRGVSVLQGIKDKVGNAIKVTFAEGCRITESEADWNADKVVPADPALNARRIAEAVPVARAADVVLLVLGENESTAREAWAENHLGDRDSLQLLGQQDDLVKAVLATGKPVVVLLMGGRPLAVNYIAENVPAVLQGWYLGQEGGTAVADVLFGDYNPAGKLPVSVARSVGQLPIYYYQKPTARRGYLFADKSPLFPFGYGLSYTTFQYGEPRLAATRIGTGGQTTVSVAVTNTGKVAGDEIVQMYIHDQTSSVTRPVKELRGFERVTLQPGESRTVTFAITPNKLWFWNRDMKRVVEPGLFDIMVGPNSATLKTTVLEVEAR
ncbi:MAG: glycoside hydrolase family 3 N-terminal domain-containing protein [Blastocatellia bacterium]